MLRVGVLVSGGGTNLQAILDAVDRGDITNAEIALVLSNNKGAYALERAKKHHVPALVVSPKDYATRQEFNQALISTLVEYKLDLVVLAGFLVVLPPEMFEVFGGRVINIHPSLIPAFCGKGFYGLKVHEAVLARGCKVTGATVHYVDEGTDTGPIIDQKAVYVQPGDTPQTLQRRVMEEAEWVLLPKAINQIANSAK